MPQPEAERFDPLALLGQVALDPMPWDITEIAARARRTGPVTVVDMEAADIDAVLATLAPGRSLLLHWPGHDDARELAAPADPTTAASEPARRIETLPAYLRDRGLEVVDGEQWRGAYRFLDAEAVRAFATLAWWLPASARSEPAIPGRAAPVPPGPITATLSRFWLLARRPE